MVDPLTALLVAFAITLVSVILFAPQRGYYWRIQRVRRQGGRVLLEDALKDKGGVYSKGEDWGEYVLVDGEDGAHVSVGRHVDGGG